MMGRHDRDCRVLLAAGAGAGLATAFNAPIAGAVFVLEELVCKFDTRITIATFGASLGAISISRFLLGQGPDFQVEAFPYAGLGEVWPYVGLGVIAGLAGAAYNVAILKSLALGDSLRRIPIALRAAIIGASVGALGFFLPNWIGGGDDLTQRVLTELPATTMLIVMFVVRFALGAVSYAALAPGGLFAPMLVLGAQCGLLYGAPLGKLLPAAAPHPHSFVVVGMAAFFTAVVRAPLTGVILVIELTGAFTLFLPMLGACLAAMLVPTLLRNAPIYDALLERTLHAPSSPSEPRPRNPSR
jgi:CIC family chloride channel protein